MPTTLPVSSLSVSTRGNGSAPYFRDPDPSMPALQIRRENPSVMSDATSFIDSQISDVLPALIALLDTDLRYRYCNSAYRDWFGLEPESLIGRPFRDIVGESVYQAAKPRIEEALQGRDVNFEDCFDYHHGFKRHVNVHYTPQRDAGGKVTGYVSLTVDVSGRRTTEKRLLEMTQQLEAKVEERTQLLNQTLEALRTTIESAPDTVVVMDASGTIINANSSAERLFGVESKQLVGRPLSAFLPPSDVEEFSDFFEESKTNSPEIRSIKARETSLRHADGRLIPIEAAIGVSPRLDQFTAFIRDISRRRKLEADLLHVALDERRRIAQDLHDSLCQEISSVHFGLAGLASRLAGSRAEEAAQARKLTRMIEQTLDHARQIAHGLSPIMEEGDDVVRALIRLARNTEELCGLKCQVQVSADFKRMGRDVSTQIYYITQEALNNILRHAKAGRIDINISLDENDVVLKVSDDGCGFLSANNSAGRGLRFMRYRAAAVNGTIRLRNRPGGGAELECRIPAAAAAP